MIQKKERRRYASGLGDSRWALIEPLFPLAGNRSKWEKRELADAGRRSSPIYAIIDSQSVKTASAAEERGIDGGKKRKGANGTS